MKSVRFWTAGLQRVKKAGFQRVKKAGFQRVKKAGLERVKKHWFSKSTKFANLNIESFPSSSCTLSFWLSRICSSQLNASSFLRTLIGPSRTFVITSSSSRSSSDWALLATASLSSSSTFVARELTSADLCCSFSWSLEGDSLRNSPFPFWNVNSAFHGSNELETLLLTYRPWTRPYMAVTN